MATQPNLAHFPGTPTPTDDAPVMVGRPLATKLARVLSEVHRVPKNGRNDFHNYDYATESDLVDHIRDKLAEQGVMVFPSVTGHEIAEMQDNRNRTVYLTTVTMQMTMIDGESGDCMTTTWVGQALDNADKGYYKAYTGALKYFLMKTFMISTGDDPEIDDAPRPTAGMRNGRGNGSVVDSRKPRQHQPAPGRAPAPAAPTPAPANAPEVEVDEEWTQQAEHFRTLLRECLSEEVSAQFEELYVSLMGASTLQEIDASKIIAMSRRLEGKDLDARAAFVQEKLAQV